MKKPIKLLKMNLQTFADPEGTKENTKETDTTKNEEKTNVELTEEELRKKIESESDRKLQSALQKKEEEWETKTQEAIKQALAEEKRLSKLSEKQREQELMSKREQELEKREKDLNRKELKADAVADLSQKGLPTDFADVLLADNAEKTLENINSFKSAFDKAVNEAVKEQLRQDTPGAGRGSQANKNPFTEEHFNLTEQGRLYREDKELYNKLKAQAQNN